MFQTLASLGCGIKTRSCSVAHAGTQVVLKLAILLLLPLECHEIIWNRDASFLLLFCLFFDRVSLYNPDCYCSVGFDRVSLHNLDWP